MRNDVGWRPNSRFEWTLYSKLFNLASALHLSYIFTNSSESIHWLGNAAVYQLQHKCLLTRGKYFTVGACVCLFRAKPWMKRATVRLRFGPLRGLKLPLWTTEQKVLEAVLSTKCCCKQVNQCLFASVLCIYGCYVAYVKNNTYMAFIPLELSWPLAETQVVFLIEKLIKVVTSRRTRFASLRIFGQLRVTLDLQLID